MKSLIWGHNTDKAILLTELTFLIRNRQRKWRRVTRNGILSPGSIKLKVFPDSVLRVLLLLYPLLRFECGTYHHHTTALCI